MLQTICTVHVPCVCIHKIHTIFFTQCTCDIHTHYTYNVRTCTQYTHTYVRTTLSDPSHPTLSHTASRYPPSSGSSMGPYTFLCVLATTPSKWSRKSWSTTSAHAVTFQLYLHTGKGGSAHNRCNTAHNGCNTAHNRCNTARNRCNTARNGCNTACNKEVQYSVCHIETIYTIIYISSCMPAPTTLSNLRMWTLKQAWRTSHLIVLYNVIEKKSTGMSAGVNKDNCVKILCIWQLFPCS